jgi:hypothetical protein
MPESAKCLPKTDPLSAGGAPPVVLFSQFCGVTHANGDRNSPLSRGSTDSQTAPLSARFAKWKPRDSRRCSRASEIRPAGDAVTSMMFAVTTGIGRGRAPYLADLLRTKAARNPRTVMNPAKSCASANASGIIVSASMARIAPAAMAVVAAMTPSDKWLNTP